MPSRASGTHCGSTYSRLWFLGEGFLFFGLRILVSGAVLGFWARFLVFDVWFWVGAFGFRVPLLVFCVECLVFGFRFLFFGLSFWFRGSGFLFFDWTCGFRLDFLVFGQSV